MKKEQIEQFFELLDEVPYWEWEKLRDQVEAIYRVNRQNIPFDAGDMKDFFAEALAKNMPASESIK